MLERLWRPRAVRPEIQNPSTSEVIEITQRALADDKVLRTDPAMAERDLRPGQLAGRCYSYSRRVRTALYVQEGLLTEVAHPESVGDPPHFYVEVGNDEDTLIDPTIGQFLSHHNHVFIGTRTELRTLVEANTGHTISTNGTNPENFFEENWGTNSVRVPLRRPRLRRAA